MGLKDTVTIKLMRQNLFFADAFNFFIYNGRQVINPDNLEEIDTRELDVPYGGQGDAWLPVQKTRDVMKSLVAMADRRCAYLLLAIENLSEVHYAMPVKNMMSDALQYAKQTEKAASAHKAAKDYKGERAGAEFLSGFKKDDRLVPVITLVIQFNDKEWDAPCSLHEMFQIQDPELLQLVPDYKINLISPRAVLDEDFSRFHSNLGGILSFIKYHNRQLRNSHIEDQSLAE